MWKWWPQRESAELRAALSNLKSLALRSKLEGDEDASIEAALLHAEARVRGAALEALSQLITSLGFRPSLSVAETVVALSKDLSEAVRAEACVSLALIESRPPFEAPRQAALLRALDDVSASVRQEACAALGDLKLESAQPQLESKLSDPDLAVRFEAAFALAQWGAPVARAELEVALDDPLRRADAMRALGDLGRPEARPALERVIRRPGLTWLERLTGWASLARLGDEAAAHALIARLGSRRFEERAHAAALCGELRLQTASESLRTLISTRRDASREMALQSLIAVGGVDDVEWLRARERDAACQDAAQALSERLNPGTGRG